MNRKKLLYSKQILCNKVSLPSAKLLRDIISEKTGGILIKVTSDPRKTTDILVRYGNSFPANGKDNSINSAEFIRTCSSKLLFARTMQEHDIYSPVFYKSVDNLTFPLLIRQTLNGSRGVGIIKITNMEEFDKNWKSSYYWTPFIDLHYELRIHMLGGEIAKVFKKVEKEDLGEMPIRNNEVCHFSLVRLEKYPRLVEIGNKLKEIFGENWFGALDVGWDRNQKKYFCMEMNSGPGLNKNTAEDYAAFIISKMEERCATYFTRKDI